MKRKNTTLISLVLAIALALTACNGDDPDDGGTTAPVDATTTTAP